MAKFCFYCYLTFLTLFCHFESHAHQEMTDIFTGQEKQQPLKQGKREIYKIAPKVLFKRLFSSQEVFFFRDSMNPGTMSKTEQLFTCTGLKHV